MEGISVSMCRGLKEYWERRRYKRLDGSARRRRNSVQLGTVGRSPFWRIKVAPKIRILGIISPKKSLPCLRDAYVRMMMRLANSRVMSMSAAATGFGGVGALAGDTRGAFGRVPVKEYDEKMIVEMYKSLMMAQGQLVARNKARIAS